MNYLFRNRARRDDAVFSALIATPAVGVFTLPANSRIDVNVSILSKTSQVTIEANGRTISLPDLAAEEFHNLGYFEKDTNFNFSVSIAGVLTFYTVDALGVRRKIARSA